MTAYLPAGHVGQPDLDHQGRDVVEPNRVDAAAVTVQDILRRTGTAGILVEVDEERGIYRGEVMAIMGALADIQTGTNEILRILSDEADDEEEEMDA